MEPSTQKLFDRVAAKLGWDKPGALDRAADEGSRLVRLGSCPQDQIPVQVPDLTTEVLMSEIPSRSTAPQLPTVPSRMVSNAELRNSLKSRRHAVPSYDSLNKQLLSDGDESEKENLPGQEKTASNRAMLDSSDDEFDQILAHKATPKAACKQIFSAKKMREPIPVLSSDSDDSFENFLSRVKTPKAQARLQSVSSSDDSLKHFIVGELSSDEDFVVEEKKKKQPPISIGNPKTPKSLARSDKPLPPLSQYDSPVFISDSDDDSDIVIRSTWRTRHSRPAGQPSSRERDAPVKEHAPRFPSPLASVHTPGPASAPPPHSRPCEDSASSEDEFRSLVDRIKKNHKLESGNGSSHTPLKPPSEPKATTGTLSARGQRQSDPGRVKASRVDSTPAQTRPSKPVSQTEPRAGPISRVTICKTPGCFLQSLSVPGSAYSRNFKQNKEELTSKLYQLYNSSVFESKLPADMSVTWNTKLRKTAGYCITGQERITGKRYARIELSVKVCDSADRLRDTLVHEMCHAATWLINNVRDGHGPFWKIYARKATLAHPELPMVTRCHSYDINYKYQYQCVRCKNTIGRHSKSLDTQRFVCALCTGQLVLLTPSNSRGPTPFATFVKENYGAARQELAGQSHAEVMRKLSADFASKTRLSQS